MTDEDQDFLRAFIADRDWRFAYTMRWNPHEYTIKEWREEDPADVEDFHRVLTLVATQGYTGKWGKRLWPYLDFDGQTYYTFGAPFVNTHVLNRKWSEKVDADRSAPSWEALGLWTPHGTYDPNAGAVA